MIFQYRLKVIALLTCCFLVCWLLSFNAFADSAKNLPESQVTASKKILLVGALKGNSIPYFAVKENNKVGGIYPEYIEHLASTLNLQIHYQFYNSVAQLEDAAKQGRVDIALGLQVTDARKDYLTLSKIIMTVPRTVLIAKEIEASPFQLNANPAVNLALFKYDVDKEYIKQLFPDIKKVEIKQQQDLAPAFHYGLVNAHFGDSLSNQYLASKLAINKFSIVSLDHTANKVFHIPLISKNSTLNNAINKLIENTDPITVSAIVAHASQWQHYTKKPVMVINPQQQDWLKQHQVIRYTTLPQWHTITMYDQSGKPKGLSIDVLNRIAEKLGVTLEYVPTHSREEALALLKTGDVDLVPAVLRLQSRNDIMSFSQPYLSTPWSMVGRKDSQLDVTLLRQGKYKIASPNSDYARAIILDYFPNSELIMQSNIEESFALLDEKEVDAVFTTLAASQSWIEHGGNHHYKLIHDFLVNNNIDIQLGVSKHSQELLGLVNNGLDAIGYDQLDSLARSWVELNPNQGVNIKQIIFYSLLACALFLLVVVGFLYWNNKLRQEVRFRRNAQQRALQAEQKLTSIANAIPGAVVQFKIVNKQLIFTYASKGIERFTPFKRINLSTEEAVNLTDEDFLALISKDQVDQLINAATQALNDNQGIDFECELNAPYRNWLNLVAFPAYQGDDCVWSGVLLEINQRKEQEIALSEEKTKAEQAALAKSRFLAMMSHEIRTPLSGVITTTELLSQSALDYQQRDDVNTIATSANNLLHILNDVLDHTKMEEQQFAIEKIECDLLDIVENAVRAHVANTQAKNLTMRVDFDPQLQRFIETDPVRLQQVLSNLLSNAVKFTEQGKITISVNALHNVGNVQHVEFKVTDAGLGIAIENQSKLFTPFMQAESSTNRQYGGTGLGLSICQMLVNRLGGEITLHSDLGKGSEFSFVIPLECYKTAELPTTPVEKSLLLLDDGSECIAQVINYLKRWGIAFIHEPNHSNPESWLNPHNYTNCMVIFHQQLSNISHLKTSDASNVWVKLCMAANNELDADLFIPSNPLLVSPLLNLIAKANDSQLMDTVHQEQNHEIILQSREQAISSGRLILVAEDHPTNRQVIKRQLETLGYQADYVENGVQALQAITEQHYNLLITDCHMPELDGYGLTRALREQGNNMPIIAFTANALTGEAQRCLDIGMNGYISKPVSQSVLQAKLNKYLPTLSQITIPVSSVQNNLPINTHHKATEMHFNILELQTMFGSKESVLELLAEFIDSLKADISELSDAYAQLDFTQLNTIAHRLKGAAQMVMANALSELASTLENAAKQQQAALCKLKITALNDCLKQYENSLNTLF
ncbi:MULTISPECIES: ATP-binding protein [Pseudoalteromonas]|uniref:ATP-binding protein n=1 Tax=Pseudoalteromonas TaxID=53246 RepID=UPI00031D673E|nr:MULTISPECIES: transporter substrate-binding domain-containing protein [Pseudoalteromonas]MCF6146280.1 hypothetical protein [Pseudoalteromonas mariniglutinosa NCIMB 1770]